MGYEFFELIFQWQELVQFPIIEGSTPASAYPVKVAKIGKFKVLATSRVVKIKAAAPSLIPEEFPAVTTPSFFKGRS